MGLIDDLKNFFKTETVRLHPETIRQLSAGRAEYRPKGVLTFEPARGSRHPELETPLKVWSVVYATNSVTRHDLLPRTSENVLIVVSQVRVCVYVPAPVAPLSGFLGSVFTMDYNKSLIALVNLGAIPNTAGVHVFKAPGDALTLNADEGVKNLIQINDGSFIVSTYYYEIERG